MNRVNQAAMVPQDQKDPKVTLVTQVRLAHEVTQAHQEIQYVLDILFAFQFIVINFENF